MDGTEHLSLSGIKSYSLDYVKRLFDPTQYNFRFFNDGNATVLSTSFAVQLLFLLNDLHEYPLNNICAALKIQQDNKTGLFIDHNFKLSEIKGFDSEFVLWGFTFFATIALDMLNQLPNHQFEFLVNLKDEKTLDEWLAQQDKNFWYTSNKLMYLFYFLIFEQERLKIDNKSVIRHLFAFLDLHQDADTGFWGARNETSAEHAMFGAAHVYQFYDFCGREISHVRAIVDSTLALQNPYGLFGSRFGGACEDFDGVEVLCMIAKRYDYKGETVKGASCNTYRAIGNKQNPDGGFSYYLDTRSGIKRALDAIRSRKYVYRYGGWQRMQNDGLKSDLWATYFRILTMAKVERLLNLEGHHQYTFYSLPGWGYY
jgi:hypothetical protein